MSEKKIVIAYHNDFDGVEAAHFFDLFKQYFPDEKLEYIGFDHPAKLGQLKALNKHAGCGNDLFFLDYALSLEKTVKLAPLFNKIKILDHHVKAKEFLKNENPLPENIEVHVDEEKSGGEIALNYLKARFDKDFIEPAFVRPASRLDRGVLNPDDYAASCFLDPMLNDLKLPEAFAALDGISNMTEAEIIAKGRPLEGKFKKAAENLLKRPGYIFINDVWHPLIEYNLMNEGGRILANEAAKKTKEQNFGSDFFLFWCAKGDKINLSARTMKEGANAGGFSEDIGKRLGFGEGGGHEHMGCALLPREAFAQLPKRSYFKHAACKMLARATQYADNIAALKPAFGSLSRLFNVRDVRQYNPTR